MVWRFGFIAAIGLIGSSNLWATSIMGGDVPQMSQEAAWIGRIEIDSMDLVSSGSFPITKVQARILEVFKGDGEVGQALRFEIPGGMKGRKSYAILGFPRFRQGQSYIVFLNSSPFSSSSALSLGAGISLVGWTAFRVVNKPGSSDEKVVVRVGEATLVKSSDGLQRMALSHDRAIRTYDSFVSEIYRSLN